MTLPAQDALWLRSWAAGILKLEEPYSPERVRAAFLAKLDEFHGAAPLAVRQAFQVLTGKWHSDQLQVARFYPIRSAHEEVLCQSVEEFSTQFWDMPPAARRRRWEELLSACARAPKASVRLRGMAGAVDLEAPMSGFDEITSELIAGLKRLSVCGLVAGALLREQLIEKAQGQRKWRVAVDRLRSNLPALAQLHNGFLSQVGQRNAPPRLQPRKAAAQKASGSGLRPRWLTLFIIIALVRAFGGGCSDNVTNTPPRDYRWPTKSTEWKYQDRPRGPLKQPKGKTGLEKLFEEKLDDTMEFRAFRENLEEQKKKKEGR
jgi:hypothetical protein